MQISKMENIMKTIQICCIGERKPKYSFIEQINGNLIGFSINAAAKAENIRVARKAFYTDYDGDFFFSCLDSISNVFLNTWLMKTKKTHSEISNCLIFLNKDGQARVFINFPVRLQILLKEEYNPLEKIYKKDIADIKTVDLPGVHFFEKCAIIFIFSNGWRRGVYFNFFPLDENYESDNENLNELFAKFFGYLQFPEIFRQTPEIKQKLYERGWFPFIRLLGFNYSTIFNSINNELPLDETEIQVVNSYDNLIENIVASWMKNPSFKERELFIKRGIERYLKGDYISSISNLYLQIEGLIRGLPLERKDEKRDSMGQILTNKLTEITNINNPDSTLFISDQFKDYLINSYFSKFDLEKGPAELSRHSFAHGMAINENDYNKITAFQTILILDQISFYIMNTSK